MNVSSLETLGWNAFFQKQYKETENHDNFTPMRVVAEHRLHYRLRGVDGELNAIIPGRWRHHANGREMLPSVGDWVLIAREAALKNDSETMIRHLLRRQSCLVRQAPGDKTDMQVIGSNLDVVFVVCAVGGDFSPRRVERYLTSVWEGGSRPVVLLSKTDLANNLPYLIERMESVAMGVPVVPLSAVTPEGLEPLFAFLAPGQTMALVGSSGVGKSTIVNALLGSEVQATKTVREIDQTGRHTTTSRSLFLLPQERGLLLDTPGMRELQVWNGQEALATTFQDIETMVLACRFSNCQHGNEPGCAVQSAIEAGELDIRRLEGYRKLQRESEYQARKRDAAALHQERKQRKQFGRMIRRITKANPKC